MYPILFRLLEDIGTILIGNSRHERVDGGIERGETRWELGTGSEREPEFQENPLFSTIYHKNPPDRVETWWRPGGDSPEG
jgi:hypothetical protein